jgi:hypothetical protein
VKTPKRFLTKTPKPVTMWVDGHDMTPGLQKIVGHVFGATEFRSGWSRYTIGSNAWRTKKEALAARKADTHD